MSKTVQPANSSVRMTADERRESILDAALRVFVARSYRGATTADIAGVAGCNEALIFRHFGSKTGLFIEVLDLATKLIRLEADFGAGENQRGLSALEALARYKGQHPDDRYQDLARLRFIAATETAEPEITRALHDHLWALHDWTAERLHEAQEASELADGVDPALAAWEWSSAMTMTSLRLCAGDANARAHFERMAMSLIDSWRRR